LLVLPHEANKLYDIVGNTPSPDTSFIYSANDVFYMAETYGQAGRDYYISSRFSFDIIWPIVYTLFFLFTFAYLVKKDKTITRFIYLLPIISFSFDILENSLASLIFYYYPLRLVILAHILPFATFIKWLSISCSILLLFYLSYLNVKKRLA
jgi:hypothetical protein